MRKIIFYFLIILIISCSESHKSKNTVRNVIINTLQDTIKSGTIFEAHLSINNNQTINPEFKIIKEDTSLLRYDINNKYAIYKAIGGYLGKHIVNGVVYYIGNDNVRRKENFFIIYYVK